MPHRTMQPTNDTFIRVTNEDIYTRILVLEKKQDLFISRIEAQEQRVDTLVKAVWILFTAGISGIVGLFLNFVKGSP